ncbi:hypothetical protein CAPTEDRAFT_201360 [Capitella teleta]|uniref:Uncharacterized protein n=1 Tax=Capitella teleta TaxID=283909 RepID=R7TBM2_CAPTE|nr:hypothetical protein CAPTEDRAFT_201360 [Capitella teleta]|eukprot:ELT91114.1 hypothetical protein CAPTEDRAFT_201360 [Capitella teleta]
MLNCGVPWVADGYHGLACKSHTGRRRSVPVALLEVERGISVDTQLMLGLQPSTPVNRQKARVQSANIVRLHPKVKHAEHTRFHSGFRGSQRPSSGHLAQRRKSQTPTRRPVSARAQFRSTTPKPSKTVHGRPMSAPVTRPSSSCGSFADPKDPSMRRPWSTTGRGPAPGHHYLDRHARCLGNTHIHQDLLRMRPRMACDHPGSVCPDRDVCQRADKSKTIMQKEADRRATRHEQYVNNLRPRTAPPAVRVIRGAVPHFCNFIRSKLIHDKALSTEDILKIDDDDRPPRPKEAFAADDTINYDVLDLGSQQEKTEGLKESIQTSPRNGLPSAPEIIMLFVSIYIAYCDYGPISPHKDKELIEPCPPEPAFEPHEEAGEEAPVVQEDIRVEYREELAEEPKKVEVKKLDGESNAQLLF